MTDSVTPPAGTPPAGTPPAGTPPAPAPAAAWHGIPETDTAGLEYIKNKGWTGPADVIKSYQGAEKVIGRNPADLLVMPRADDPNGLLSVLDKLGRPPSADKYEFAKPPEGIAPDESYEKFARSTFHEIGLLPGQVKTLTEKHNAYVAEQMKAAETAYNASVEADKKALAQEWQNGTERMMAMAKAAAATLGFDEDLLAGIERVKGYGATWKFMAELGKKMGEPGFVTPDGKPKFNGQMTPAEASAEWDRMKNDPIVKAALLDKTHPDHAKHQKTQNALFAVMYPNG